MKILKVPVEVYSRVVGYFRPVNQWNKGKQEEFKDREKYIVPEEIKDDTKKII
jgi:ribonucleoside-triphosphate reductase